MCRRREKVENHCPGDFEISTCARALHEGDDADVTSARPAVLTRPVTQYGQMTFINSRVLGFSLSNDPRRQTPVDVAHLRGLAPVPVQVREGRSRAAARYLSRLAGTMPRDLGT